jgi:hypothetical protein
MAIIISSKISSDLVSTLKNIDKRENNLANFYYFAILDDTNTVNSIIVADFDVAEKMSSDSETDYFLSLSINNYDIENNPGLICKVGYTWDSENQVFIEPRPFTSWSLNTDKWIWESPVPKPKDDYYYIWNEEKLSWIKPYQDLE